MTRDPLDRLKRFIEGEGLRIGRYVDAREVARGGMGVVYEAVDPDLGRRVAVKVLKEATPLLLERLRREAAAAAKLRHPNIVTVHEVGPDFIAMDFVEGKTLAEALPALGPREGLRVLEAVARASGYAHAQGVVHRDLKPANVLIGPGGAPVLTDFGLARMEGGEDLTRTGAVVGTPHYMSPEQVRGERTGPAADVWSLGVMLYEMLAGRKPFDGGSALEIYDRIVRAEPAPAPGDAGTVALKALEKDPARRYADGAEFADELARLLRDEPVRARPPGRAERLRRRLRKNPLLYFAVGAAAASIAAAGALAWLGSSERERALRAIQAQARISLEAALKLRRAGANAGMRDFLPPLEEAYREAVARAPDLAEADYLLGRMHRALMDFEKAREFQDRALEKDPAYVPALYERAVLATRAYARELRKAYPEGPVLPEEAERLRAEIGPLRSAAVRAATRLQALLPGGLDPVSVLVAEGLARYHVGQYGEAGRRLEEAVAKDPLLEEGWEGLALALEAELAPGVKDRERRWREAEESYTRALERDRGFVPHLLGRSDVRMARADHARDRGGDPLPHFAEAEEDLTRALELSPGSADALVRRGRVRTQRAVYKVKYGLDPREDCARAEADFARAIEADGRLTGAWTWRGNVRYHRGVYRAREGEDPREDYAAGEADLSKSLEIQPRDADALMRRGRLRAARASYRARLGEDPAADFAAAEEDFAEALRLNPSSPWGMTWRGTARLHHGLFLSSRSRDPLPEFARAEEDFSRTIQGAPEHAEAWQERGNARWYRAAHQELAGREPDAWRDYAAAAGDYLKALSLNPALERFVGDRMRLAQKKAAPLK